MATRGWIGICGSFQVSRRNRYSDLSPSRATPVRNKCVINIQRPKRMYFKHFAIEITDKSDNSYINLFDLVMPH